jgi:hypothetical protein
MKRVIIESPFYSPDRTELQQNVEYGLDCLRDSLLRGEAPFASHLLYTRVLDDAKTDERRLGLIAAMQWIDVADLTAVYIDRGVSPGMRMGIQRAWGRIEIRSLRGDERRVARLRDAYDPATPPSKEMSAAPCDHQLDTPMWQGAPMWRDPVGSENRGRFQLHCIVGWRCVCGAIQEEVVRTAE